MDKLHILTLVKDSLDTALGTINSVMESEINVEFSYTVYNDFSSEQTTQILERESEKLGFTLFHLKSITMHPSPNFLLVLQIAQQRANFENASLLIIEPDIIVQKKTIQQMVDAASTLDKPGLVAAMTTDQNGKVNYPYLYARKYKPGVLNTTKRIDFCSTLFTPAFLTAFNFDTLSPEQGWYVDFISIKSIELGFKNYLLTSLPVVHLDSGRKDWNILKFFHLLRYYWNN